MARIGLSGVRHTYPGSTLAALADIDHAFEDGGAYALLGPSGCGKTTLLNVISGLVRPSQGRVLFDGDDVTGLAPERRNIAQVFQFPVVYDSMTVRENLAFPLRNRRLPPAEIDRRVEAILAVTGLTAVARKPARGLTADQKQKISLGRGLVRSDVAAILFDEPLTVIDPEMKWVLRGELKALHREFRRTMVYVTHDQTEALTFADTVVVMYEGEIVQIGDPQTLFERPEHTFVGHFIGSPGMNVLPAEVSGKSARVGARIVPLRAPVAGGTEIGIRPEAVRIAREGLPATLLRVEDIGRSKIVRLSFEGREIAALVPEAAEIPAEPKITFDPSAIHVYADSRRVEYLP